MDIEISPNLNQVLRINNSFQILKNAGLQNIVVQPNPGSLTFTETFKWIADNLEYIDSLYKET